MKFNAEKTIYVPFSLSHSKKKQAIGKLSSQKLNCYRKKQQQESYYNNW